MVISVQKKLIQNENHTNAFRGLKIAIKKLKAKTSYLYLTLKNIFFSFILFYMRYRVACVNHQESKALRRKFAALFKYRQWLLRDRNIFQVSCFFFF